jgi:hypothetical protein
MENFTLKFGKHKGMQFLSTPKSYQQWLLAQDWFKVPTVLTPLQEAEKNFSQLSSQLRGWDGYSSRGTAIYDAMFSAEQAMASALEDEQKYCGMDEETKRLFMNSEYEEIVQSNMIYEFYND